MIANVLIDEALSKSKDRVVKDVRAGLGYTCVMLSDNSCGLAYTFRNELGQCCGILGTAGNLIGIGVNKIIPWAKDSNRLKAAIGLAAINAVTNESGRAWETGNVLEAIKIEPSGTFGMVGEFKPILAKVKPITNNIYVFEQSVRQEGILYNADTIPVHLPKCDVIVITATSIINHTFDEIIPYCNNAKELCLVGPSTPLCPDIFRQYNITLLAGSVVKKPELILQIVSQGGGTMSMKPAVDQVLVRV